MFVVTVTFTITPDGVERFLREVTRNATTSLEEEPGCKRFDVCHDPDRPEEVFLYEIYSDRAAFDAHLGAAHFKSFDALAAPLTKDKQVRTYSLVGDASASSDG